MATSEMTAHNSSAYSWHDYYEMTKPKVVLLITFTALVGMLLSTWGMVPWQPLLFGLLGISLSLIHISEPTRPILVSRMPSSA